MSRRTVVSRPLRRLPDGRGRGVAADSISSPASRSPWRLLNVPNFIKSEVAQPTFSRNERHPFGRLSTADLFFQIFEFGSG
jgi:hypothetical protein